MFTILFVSALLASSAYSSSKVVVEGENSEIKTSIRVEVDGKVKTFETDKPGEYSIEMGGANAKSTVKTETNTKRIIPSPGTNITITAKPLAVAGTVVSDLKNDPSVKVVRHTIYEFLQRLVGVIANLFKGLK